MFMFDTEDMKIEQSPNRDDKERHDPLQHTKKDEEITSPNRTARVHVGMEIKEEDIWIPPSFEISDTEIESDEERLNYKRHSSTNSQQPISLSVVADDCRNTSPPRKVAKCGFGDNAYSVRKVAETANNEQTLYVIEILDEVKDTKTKSDQEETDTDIHNFHTLDSSNAHMEIGSRQETNPFSIQKKKDEHVEINSCQNVNHSLIQETNDEREEIISCQNVDHSLIQETNDEREEIISCQNVDHSLIQGTSSGFRKISPQPVNTYQNKKKLQNKIIEIRRKNCIPNRLPPNITARCEKQNFMNPIDRQCILRGIDSSMMNYGLTSDKDYEEIANLAIKKYPLLECAAYKGMRGIMKALKNVRRNRKHYEKQKHENILKNISSVDSREFIELRQTILKEWNSRRSIPKLKALLDATRATRLADLRKLSYNEYIALFPCLKDKCLVFHEFLKENNLTDITLDDLNLRWLEYLPKMGLYFKKNTINFSSLSDDQATVQILQSISSPCFFGPRISLETREPGSSFIEIIPNLDSIISSTRYDPPRILIKQEWENHRFISSAIVIDGNEPICFDSVVDALIHMVIVYYVFNIKPHQKAGAAFAFIAGILLPDIAEKRYKNYLSVCKALDCMNQL